MIASSKTWAGSATHMWTCCPRQAWPHGSLTIKHYRILVRIHHQGCWSLTQVHGLDPKHRLLFLEQFNQWLGVLGNTYGVEVINLPNHTIHSHMHNWLRMVPGKTKTIFLELTAATYTKCTWTGEGHFFHPTYASWTGHEGIAYKFSTLGWCSTWIMGETKCCWWAQ